MAEIDEPNIDAQTQAHRAQHQPGMEPQARANPQLKLHVLASGSKGNCSVIENVATGACVVGMHVSENNNTYRLPQDTFQETLERFDHPAQALVGYQSRPISV